MIFNMLNQDKFDNLLKKARQNPDDGSIKQHLLAGLSPEDRSKLQKMLNDRQAVERIMSSPEAQALLKKIKENNG